jgi:hypothetical protein
MNEQIREFAKQAGFYKYGDDFEEIIEKFAELIIEECVDYAFANGDNVDYLKQYFGVE